MHRINTFLILFLSFVLILAVGSWTFLQSQTFGRIISKTITKISAEELNAKIRFSRVNIRFFPPSLGLENISLKYDNEGTEISAQAGEIGVVFDVGLFKDDKIHLKQIYLEQGHAEILLAKNETSSTDNPWDLIQNEIKKLPIDINELQINESKIDILGSSIDVHQMNISIEDKKIGFNGELKHLKNESIEQSIDLVKVKGELKRAELLVDEIIILQKRSMISLKAKIINWSDVNRLSVNGEFDSDVFVPDASEWVKVDLLNFKDGNLKTTGRFTWSQARGVQVENKFIISKLDSSFLVSDEIVGELKSDEQKVILESLKVTNKNESLVINSPTVMWDSDRKKILPEGVRASLNKFELNNGLRIIGDSLQVLRGSLTGQLDFRLDGTNLYFKPQDNLKISNLRLEIPTEGPKKEFTVLNVSDATLFDSEFIVEDGEFKMSSRLKAAATDLKIDGRVGKETVKFDVARGPLNLEDLGNVAGLDFKGFGENSISVYGNLDDVKIKIEGSFSQFEFLEYKLGDTKHSFIIDLKSGVVDINDFRSKKGRYEYQGSGKVNYRDFDLDFSIDMPEMGFNQLKDIIYPLRAGLAFLPNNFDALLQGNLEILAKGSIENIKVSSDVYAQRITAYDESIKNAKFNFSYYMKLIQIQSLSVLKDQGRVDGSIKYDLNESALHYKLSARNLQSSEFNFYKKLPLSIDFSAVGEFEGVFRDAGWSHKGFVGLTKSVIDDETIPDSSFRWDFNQNSVSLEGALAGDWLLLSANSQGEGKRKVLNTNALVNIQNLPLFLRGMLGENTHLNSAQGSLDMSLEATLPDFDLEKITGKLWLKNLNLKTTQIDLKQNFNKPQIVIQKGFIKKWDIGISSADLDFSSVGEGSFDKKFKNTNKISLDAKYFELLTKHIQRSQGKASAEGYITYQKDAPLIFSGASRGSNLVVSTDFLPFALSDLNYSLKFQNKDLEIEKFSFRPDSGLVSVSGAVIFDNTKPDLNLRYSLDRASIPILSRSRLLLSGNGMIFGGKPPYLINGDLIINKSVIINEINDFTGSSSIVSDSKYLPTDQESSIAGIANLDLSVKTESPIQINNSMMDVFLLADLQLSGEMIRPFADGRVYSTGMQSKVFFKNSEYYLSKAEIQFNGRKSITKPDFDIVASSSIANYKIFAKAFGNPESFTFDLSSEPALSQQNILSLIAFGYTEDISNAISPEEKQQLTNVGVGSFIFDQFKVTDIVKKQFGLQVNLGTMFVQAEESMLAGRGQEQSGSGTLARTRTATNIEVKKRLSDAMTLSVSSTVGGQIGQRQKMNLNYGISRNVQLEGVYELRTNAEGQEDIIDNSIGGDVKIRMTFK